MWDHQIKNLNVRDLMWDPNLSLFQWVSPHSQTKTNFKRCSCKWCNQIAQFMNKFCYSIMLIFQISNMYMTKKGVFELIFQIFNMYMDKKRPFSAIFACSLFLYRRYSAFGYIGKSVRSPIFFFLICDLILFLWDHAQKMGAISLKKG